MRRVSQTLMLLLVVAVALLWIVTPADAGQKGAAGGGAPKPDGRFRAVTTSISPNMGPSFADGEFSYNNQDYKFRAEAETMADSQSLNYFAGQQIQYEGAVYNLKNVSDFAGTYKRLKPEVVKAMGGTGTRPVFQNEKGVILVLTKTHRSRPELSLRLLGDSFKVTLQQL